MHACMLSCFSHVRLFVTLWAVAHQAPLSMRFSRQEYWSGLSCPTPGDLLSPGIEASFLRSLHWQAGFLAQKEQVVECLAWDNIPNFKNLKFTNQYCVCMWWPKTKNIKMWNGKIYSNSKWLRLEEGVESQMQEVYKRSPKCNC